MTHVENAPLARQHEARPVHRAHLRLVPPLADEFSVVGTHDTTGRAQQWALDHHYLLAGSIPVCAHGLYLLDSCPNRTGVCCEQFDHTQIWVPYLPDGEHAGRPFILTHPYSDEISAETSSYARAHGLHVSSYPELDGWYGHGTLPIRLTIPDNYPVWPIEAEALVMLWAQPVRWPQAVDD